MEKLQVAILCHPETISWIRSTSKEQGLTMGKFVGLLLDQARTEQSETGPMAPVGPSPSKSTPATPQEASEVVQERKTPQPVQETSAAPQDDEWTKSDPEALKALLDGMDEHLLSLEPSYEQRLQEALRRLRNPGDFLDSEAESAVEACGRLAESGLLAINEARQARHRIIASWGENLAHLILNIHENESELEDCGPRKTRALNRKISSMKETLSDFRTKIRADQRSDSNIPNTVEDAEKLLARRADKRPPFVVLQGSKKTG
jgi:hypothetical protein